MRISCLQSAYWYANNLVTLIMNSERFLNKASNYVLSFNNIQFVTFQGPPESRLSHFLFCVSISHWHSKCAGHRVTCLRSYHRIYYCDLKICLLYTKGIKNTVFAVMLVTENLSNHSMPSICLQLILNILNLLFLSVFLLLFVCFSY